MRVLAKGKRRPEREIPHILGLRDERVGEARARVAGWQRVPSDKTSRVLFHSAVFFSENALSLPLS